MYCFVLKTFSFLTELESYVDNKILFNLSKLFTNKVTKVVKEFIRYRKPTLLICETVHQHKLIVILNIFKNENIC